jgi:hypothetical protein
VKTQVRILFALAAVALLAGWLGLRRGNAALEARLYGGEPPRQEAVR